MENTHPHQVYSQRQDIPFEAVSVIGSGPTGVVEEVKGTAGPFQGRVYARKVLRASHARERMMREIGKVKTVQHDHVVRIVTTYSFQKIYAIIMDPRADMDLKRYLRMEKTPQARERISQWFGCLINGLAFLHDMKIRHGNIEPSQVLIKDNTVLLTDPSTTGQWEEALTTTTSTTSSTSTSRYAAPEVEQGVWQVSRRADIFSLGIVFLEMFVVGSHPQKIEEFDYDLQSKSMREYSGRVDRVSKWMDAVSQTPDKLPWHSTIARLCVDMLQDDANERPKAGDLRLWWSYQPPTMLPSTPCKCSLAANEADHRSPARIKDALETAREKDYTMSIELLSGKSAELGGKKILPAFKGWLRNGPASRV